MSQHQRSASGSSSSSGLFHYFGIDTSLTKVFVGGLAWVTDSETLRRYFEPFGEILEAVVITDKHSGRSKGYGFVTFRDPESARRACEDPTPIIDGRRANCNLASLGRPRPPPQTFVQSKPPLQFIGGLPVTRGGYVGNLGYQAVPSHYQQGYGYPQYAYTMYGPDYVYPQNVYNPQAGQQYIPIYSPPGSVNMSMYPFGQVGQLPPGVRGYTTGQGYTIPAPAYGQLSGPNVSGINVASVSAYQAPYPSGVALPIHTNTPFIVSAHSPQFTQGSNSDQTAVS